MKVLRKQIHAIIYHEVKEFIKKSRMSSNIVFIFKDILDNHNKQVLQIMAALISGSLKYKDSLEQKIDSLYHLNILSNMDTITSIKSSKLNNSKHNQQQLNSPNDSNLACFKNKKILNAFLENYLSKDSFGLLNDPNFALVNLIRNYLYLYSSDFYADLAAANKPDENHLKISINEVFNSWSSNIISALEKKSYIINLAPVEKYLIKNNVDSSEDITDHENQHNKDINDFLLQHNANFKKNQQQGSSDNNSGHVALNIAPKAVVVSLDSTKVVSSTEKLNAESNNKHSDASFMNGTSVRDGPSLGMPKVSTDRSDVSIPLLKGNVNSYTVKDVNTKVQIKNANKMFKPFLNFIGIDAPTGKFKSNLLNNQLV